MRARIRSAMRLLLACAPALVAGLFLPGCDEDPPAAPPSATDCDAGDLAFVHRALLAVTGRRAWGQTELLAYEDVLTSLRSDYQLSTKDARAVVARAMMNEPDYGPRWGEFVMDSLQVLRTQTLEAGWEVITVKSCYGPTLDAPPDTGTLAAWVRDNPPTERESPVPRFGLGKLLLSAIQLDDLSPVYRAQVFHLVKNPLNGANVEPDELERARRTDLGRIFEESFIHRDPACLACHNSEHSVTANDDPGLNRAWPIPGNFEAALYGSAEAPDDPIRYRSVFRVDGVLPTCGDPPCQVEEADTPWGWEFEGCGTFNVPFQADPLGVDAAFGSVRSTAEEPEKGLRASVWDLEKALHRGFDELAANGLVVGDDGSVDPDAGLAYLVAQNIVDRVWAELMGSRLTIANYFSRTEVQRDTLAALTHSFIESRYSLKTLLTEILTHPAFNLKMPEEGCGSGPYGLETIFDPWTTNETDPERRGNSPADGIYPVSSRVLGRSLHRAMEWQLLAPFPSEEEEAFQTSIGFFISSSNPGFRGLELQARLSWEAAYGVCTYSKTPDDFISKIVAGATATPGATLRDAIIALKDRLVGEPWIEDDAEAKALADLAGGSLEDASSSDLDARLRRVCGALVATPQFVLGGVGPKASLDIPLLTPADRAPAAMCSVVAKNFETGNSYWISCDDGQVRVHPR